MELLLADKKDKKIKVNDSVFDCDFNEGLIHQVVVAVMAQARSGTSAQKNRAAVSGGGAKPWKQKGTGRARAGTSRSPIWRKGGVTFASQTRDYSQKVNKKMYRKAVCSILSELNRTGNLIVMAEFVCKEPKTKLLKAKLAKLNLNKVLIVSNEISENVYLASRNLVDVDVTDVIALTPVQLLRYEHVIITEDAIKQLEGLLG